MTLPTAIACIGAAMLALKLFWMTGPSSRGGVE